MQRILATIIICFILTLIGVFTPVQSQETEVEVIGQLQRTVEAGGWIVTNTNTGKTYLLLNLNQCQNELWFKEGACVKVAGNIREDIVTIYMQGTPLQVKSIQPVSCTAR